MAVGIISGDSVPQPERVGAPEIIAENLFHIFPCEPRVARLDVAQQAFFGCQNGTRAIHVDTAALQHNVPAVRRRESTFAIQAAAPALRNRIIAF